MDLNLYWSSTVAWQWALGIYICEQNRQDHCPCGILGPIGETGNLKRTKPTCWHIVSRMRQDWREWQGVSRPWGRNAFGTLKRGPEDCGLCSIADKGAKSTIWSQRGRHVIVLGFLQDSGGPIHSPSLVFDSAWGQVICFGLWIWAEVTVLVPNLDHKTLQLILFTLLHFNHCYEKNLFWVAAAL